jgi:hypothetical protein
MTSITTDQFAPAEQVAVDRVTCEVTGSRSVLDTDRDGPWHSGRWPIESWFIVSNLDSGGQRLGLQLQFQIQTPPSGADAMQLDAVVVNESADISRNFEYLYPREQVELSADRMYIRTPQLTFGGDRHGCAVSFRGKGGADRHHHHHHHHHRGPAGADERAGAVLLHRCQRAVRVRVPRRCPRPEPSSSTR